MKLPRLFRLFVLLPLLAVSSIARAADDANSLPENLGSGLRQLVAWHRAQPASQTSAQRKASLLSELPAIAKNAQTDAETRRVVVNVTLDGTQSLDAVGKRMEAFGTKVTARHEVAGGRPGSMLTIRMPLERALDIAKEPGVFSVSLVHKPIRRVGKTTSQGVGVLHSDAVNAQGYDGKGITVGVLSDSYNLTTPFADVDVRNDDLPGPGNSGGHTQPIYVLAEGAQGQGNTDEGRAMLQIIHDVAPGAALAFASVGDSQLTFAANIRRLRTDPKANCDVMVDDISFPDEPFFSDGPIAQAVDDVVHSNSLPGKKNLFYSASGNDGHSGGVGYVDDFHPVDDAAARAGLAKTNLKLNQVPVNLTAGGFQNFETRANKPPLIVQQVTLTESATVCLQWDDPFTPGQVTTDYNLLIFDENGNFRNALSGTDNNFATGEPLEIIDLPLNRDGSGYQLAITRRDAGSQLATHLRYVASGSSSSSGYQATPTPSYIQPNIYGHVGAPGADGVAAFAYDDTANPEDFDSAGPMTIYFDRDQQRLATPELRQQPTMAAPDNANTSFFPQDNGSDSDGDGFPNFAGTSAAAPHAAGVAALLLQAAGGPGSLTDAQARTLLQSTAAAHDLDLFQSSARVADADGAGTVTILATGDDSNFSLADKRFFRLSFDGPSGRSLRKVVIDLAPAGLVFDPSPDQGFPFVVNKASGLSKSDITATLNDGNTALTLQFAKMAFVSGGEIAFGIDRDDPNTGMEGNSADQLANAAVTIRTLEGDGKFKGTGTFQNNVGQGYSEIVGYGLINAQAAVNKLLTSGKP
jgi:hypothetical protein